MSTINFRKCANCGVIRDAKDLFCGTCGKQFDTSISGESYPTVPSDALRQSPITPRLNDPSLFTPTQPQLVSTPQLPPRSLSHKIYLIAVLILVLVLVGTGILVGMRLGTTNNTLSPSNPSGNIPNSSNPTTTGATPPPTSPATPTPTLTPTPTPVLPGTVLCDTAKPGQGWDNWNLVTGWKVLHGELLYDGSGNGEKLVAPDSCQPTTVNYKVDVRMRIVSGCCHFGIIVRGGASTSGSTGYQLSIYTTTFQNLFISTLGGQGGATTGYGFDNNFHVWSAEVKDNVINFVIDGGKVLSLTDNTYISSAGEVSICCTDTMELEITSFKITAL